MTKQELRAIMKRKLAALPKEQFVREGAAAARRLAESPLWRRYGHVLIYLSMPDELDTSTLMEAAFQQGKYVYAPKVESDTSMRFFRVTSDKASWINGAFGIREPAGGENTVFKLEGSPVLVVSPGLAFDRSGGRLGRGKGYYDRFYEKLFAVNPESSICAFCMSCALVDEVPMEPFDRKMNALCTQNEYLAEPLPKLSAP